MTEPRRLLNLPGYDEAGADVFETDNNTDDASTTLTQQTSLPSPSVGSETSDDEDADAEDAGGVSRRRLHPERARSRFAAQGKRVEAKGVDLSDGIGGGRRGYKVRRQRSGNEEEDEEEEGLEARIARLRREVEEVRVLANGESGGVGEGRDADGGLEEEGAEEDGVEGLSRLLAGIEVPTSQGRGGRRVVRTSSAKPETWPEPAAEGLEATSDEKMLKRVADFDSRLAALEQSLGISALDALDPAAVSTPLLPSLTLLDQQLAALTSATSVSNLEAASTRIQKLKQEAAALSHAPSDSEEPTPPLSQDDLTKLHQLSLLLPTLTSLSPTVPALMTRLRSLRTLHTSAATAAAELDEVEKRQAEMVGELKAWREGLEKVEQAVKEAAVANGRNGKVVEGWVRELEGRMQGLGR